ncbi:MAG: hypothetical protein WBD58_11055 [Geitlerinemataceae cyanobacterium]
MSTLYPTDRLVRSFIPSRLRATLVHLFGGFHPAAKGVCPLRSRLSIETIALGVRTYTNSHDRVNGVRDRGV